ncbi:MAG: cytidine deaminase [Thermomicrobiales bacterium]|nr:cytidine deaminase [Thermomicrobiales bacterium]
MGDTISMEQAALLMEAARAAANHAYVPYSHFPVGAALLTMDDSIITGANVENASYPLSVCAERVTIGTAAAAGHRHIKAIAVTAPRVPVVTPCGGCRQVINEFRMPGGTVFVILEGADEPEITTIDDLLPRSFGPRDLE